MAHFSPQFHLEFLKGLGGIDADCALENSAYTELAVG